MPGAEQAIQAASNRGWEAVLLVVLVLALVTSFGMVIRWIINSTERREERQGSRITSLEAFVEGTLVKMVADCTSLMVKNTAAFDALTLALGQKPCLLDPERQSWIADRMADRIGEHVANQRREEVA